MPGTLVRDALATQLFVGATLNAAGTTSGTVAQIDKPGEVQFEFATGTVTSTGNSATADVEVKGADDLAFTVNVVSYGKFALGTGTDAAQSNKKRYMMGQVYKKYVRATVILGGTSPVYTGSTLKVVPERFQFVQATTTA